jgi:hypothetical protein
MALVNFTNLDFDQIKTSIKEYLRSNSDFSDYDFEGSNLSMLIDVLAYNTYISSYNANMVSNEVFIDSATLRENVVSLARNIGYVPRSKVSAKANISFTVNTSSLTIKPITLTLKKGTVCTSDVSFANESFSFVIPEDITVPVLNDVASFVDIDVYEGTFLTANFTVDSNNPNQKFILDNSDIDTSSISVKVRNTQQSSVANKYILSNSLFDITSSSKVFFIQEIEDQRYELIFGDGIFGKKLEDSNYIEVSYFTTSGVSGNGITSFSFSGRIVDNNERVIVDGISELKANKISKGGKEIESIASIKKYAPQIYAAQNRAVTTTDYEALIPRIYPETESVCVFGGEDLTPPKYGKVFISIKPFNGPYVPEPIKQNLKTKLRQYSVAGIVPEFMDLKYLYVELDTTIYYNSNLAPGSDYIKTIVTNNINSYADSTELNKFGARFKYSKFLKIVDDSHVSITSNITKVVMRRDLKPEIGKTADYEICFGNQFHIVNQNGYNIKSSGFNVSSIADTVYMSDSPNGDQRTGSIFLFKLLSPTEPSVVRTNVGTIDYVKGEIKLNPVQIISTSKSMEGNALIQISAIPKSNDVIGLQDLYLQLDINNSSLNMISDVISSGADTSGSSYFVTSSYTAGSIVRS